MITMKLTKNEEGEYEWQPINWACHDFIQFVNKKDLDVIAVSKKKYSYRKNAVKAAKEYAAQLNVSIYGMDREKYIFGRHDHSYLSI